MFADYPEPLLGARNTPVAPIMSGVMEARGSNEHEKTRHWSGACA